MITDLKPNKDGKYKCFVIRDRNNGGITDEWLDESAIPDDARTGALFGVKGKMLIQRDKATETYETFIQNDDVKISPRLIALIPGFKSWADLSSYIANKWENMKPFVPIVFVIVVTIAYVMITG